jgi:hypothetical protein
VIITSTPGVNFFGKSVHTDCLNFSTYRIFTTVESEAGRFKKKKILRTLPLMPQRLPKIFRLIGLSNQYFQRLPNFGFLVRCLPRDYRFIEIVRTDCYDYVIFMVFIPTVSWYKTPVNWCKFYCKSCCENYFKGCCKITVKVALKLL